MTFDKICGHEGFLVKHFGHGGHYFVVSEMHLHLHAPKICFVCVFKTERAAFIYRETLATRNFGVKRS